MFDASRLLAARVPRYTSYPTALQFHPGVDARTVAHWLEALPEEARLSLYVHIPFCDTLCWFCGCHTRVVNNYGPVASYLDLVLGEIDRVAAVIGRGRKVSHIHWGGGSPTLLAPDDIGRLATALRETFDVAADAEFAVEIDPRDLRDATIAALAIAGVNRASIGVQDNDPTVQAAVNRVQPFAETASAVKRLRRAGIAAINVDLMYGLPHQTVACVERTIADVVSLKPDRLSVFGYAHVPHMKRHQELIDAAALPGLEQRLAQYNAAHAALTGHGYVPIGLDHFARTDDPMAAAARNGSLRRNFQGYTTDAADALIGFGASAISALPQGYAQNAATVLGYRKALARGSLATERGGTLGGDDRLRRAIIERLMCDLGVDLAALTREHGGTLADLAPELAAVDALAVEGLVRRNGAVLTVPPEARVGVRLVCAAFDTYLAPAAARHALAV